MENTPDMKKIILGLVLGVAVLGIVLYGGYLYAQKFGVKITLPSGQTYLGEEALEANELVNPPTAPQRFTAGPNVPWKEYKGKVYNYSFKYPETLKLGIFPDDPTDSVAIIWGNIPAQRNIFINVENIPSRDPAYVGKVEDFARNWWKFFSGLKGLVSIEKFVNTSGLTGYRAIYINNADQSPNIDIFFAVSNDPNKVIHIANGILDPEIFERIVDSLNYEAK